jgi:hypothetical protein
VNPQPAREVAIAHFTLRRIDWQISIALTLVLLVIGALRMAPRAAGVYHDDGVYLATTKSLTEGHGYRLVDLPGAPPQTKYPFAYPLALAALWSLWPVFPDNLLLLKGFSVCCSAAAIGGTYLFLVRFRYGTRRASATACLVAATANAVGYFAAQTLSEPLFAVVTLAVLWITEDLRFRRSERGRDSLIGLCMALPFLTRTLGATVTLAALWQTHKESRLTRWIVGGACLAAGSWVVWVAVAARFLGTDQAAPSYYSASNYIGWWTETSWRVPARNTLWIIFGTAQLLCEGLAAWVPWPVPVALGLSAWCEILAGRAANRLLPRALGLYVLVTILWPWQPRRFLVPMLPFLAFYASEALRVASQQWRAKWSAALTATFVGAVVSSNIYEQAALVRLTQESGYPYPTLAAAREAKVHWADYEDLFIWLRTHTDRGAILGSGMDTMLYLYTERQAIRPFVVRPTALVYGESLPPLGTQAEFVDRLRSDHVSYVIELPMVGFSEMKPFGDLITATKRVRPSCLREVYRAQSDSRFVVYQTAPDQCGT